MVAPLADQPLAADSCAPERATQAPAGQSEKTPITSLAGQGRAQVMQAISQATARLAENGVASAHSDARQLAEFVLGQNSTCLARVFAARFLHESIAKLLGFLQRSHMTCAHKAAA